MICLFTSHCNATVCSLANGNIIYNVNKSHFVLYLLVHGVNSAIHISYHYILGLNKDTHVYIPEQPLT